MGNKELVVLVHGFFRNEQDMFSMKRYLEEFGYTAVTVNLPTTFSNFNTCIDEFERQFQGIMRVNKCSKVHFVGHSMGGLIVRGFLSKHVVPNLGRFVMIATPNHGTRLSALARLLFKPSINIFKPLQCLLPGGIDIPLPLQLSDLQIGVIAGNRNNLVLGLFLSPESDGRVEVESTKLNLMNDFVVRNYNHEEIHHKIDVAELTNIFLKTGRFL